MPQAVTPRLIRMVMVQQQNLYLSGKITTCFQHMLKELLASALIAEQQISVVSGPGCQLEQQLNTPAPLQDPSHTAAPT
ncbi:hypothetical protein MMC14_010146, partial [Varicellaria rhodocarpa]|nr:hypothetical protein [Varicellaria rhodocarpa]